MRRGHWFNVGSAQESLTVWQNTKYIGMVAGVVPPIEFYKVNIAKQHNTLIPRDFTDVKFDPEGEGSPKRVNIAVRSIGQIPPEFDWVENEEGVPIPLGGTVNIFSYRYNSPVDDFYYVEIPFDFNII